MTREWTPGTWWRAPDGDRHYAYYLCLRHCYGMTACEAWRYAKEHFKAIDAIVGGSADKLPVCLDEHHYRRHPDRDVPDDWRPPGVTC